MKALFAMLTVSLTFAATAQSKTITIACGSDTGLVYEALEKNDLSKAEFSLVLSIRGQNNPPVVTSMSDDFTDQTAQVRELGLNDKINPTKVTVTVPKGKYEINNLSCNSLDESTGDVSYSRATPSGFSGYVFVAGAKCNCVQN